MDYIINPHEGSKILIRQLIIWNTFEIVEH